MSHDRNNRHTIRLRGHLVAARSSVSIDRGPDWMTDPARGCAPEHGNDALFTSDETTDRNKAIELCRAGCPFLEQCGRYAADNDERNYVWGGRDFSKPKIQQAALRERREAERPVFQPGDDLPSNGKVFHQLTAEEQADAVRAGCAAGFTWGQLAQRFSVPRRALEKLVDAPDLDDQVKALHAEGHLDGAIAERLRCSPTTIRLSRERQNLSPNPTIAATQRAFIAAVREGWEKGRSDTDIATSLGCYAGTVGRIRQRLGLRTLYGPRGRRLEQVSA